MCVYFWVNSLVTKMIKMVSLKIKKIKKKKEKKKKIKMDLRMLLICFDFFFLF